jgi:tRNA-dihydrouridine synthase
MNTPFFVLAPMDDVTDVVFRSIVSECYKPDMFFTEFVNVDGLQSRGRQNIIHKLALNKETDHNLIGQIWGKNPDNFRITASELVEMGYHGIDINMGCPQKNEVKNGCCSALINDRELASQMIRATQEGAAGRVPVSVKCRLGWNEIDLSWHEYLLGHKIDMLSIHVRTRKEMSDVPAHWDELPNIIKIRDRVSPKTKIVMNGDIETYAQGVELANLTGADGIMIGRGIFKDPFCFSPESPWAIMTPQEKIKLYKTHVERFMASYKNREKSFQSLRKFCKTYVHGFDSATILRDQIMHTESNEHLVNVLDAFISSGIK